MVFVKLVGVVVKGVGEGRKYVEIYSKAFEDALGFKPYPGTLNVELNKESELKMPTILNSKPYAVINPPQNHLVAVYVWKSFVGKINSSSKIVAYVVRPMKTVHGLNIVELISSENIRKKLGLVDGDFVEINVVL